MVSRKDGAPPAEHFLEVSKENKAIYRTESKDAYRPLYTVKAKIPRGLEI